MIRWLTTDQVARNGVKILAYGVGGAGKTTLCATALGRRAQGTAYCGD